MFRPGNLGHLGRLGLVAASAYAQSVIVSQAYDPHYSSVSVLLHGDGADGSTTFTDSGPSARTVTTVGNAKVSTTQSKFGGASLYFDGSGDKATAAASADFVFGADDFTLEGWVYITGGQNYARMIHFGPFWGSNDAFGLLAKDADNAGKISFASYKLGASRLCVSTTSVSTNTWYHVAVTRSSGVFRLFIDGVLEATNSSHVGVSIDASSTNTLAIGSATTTSGGEDFAGYIDDVRITKGVARYTATFTPPTEPFTNSAPTIELIASASTPLGAASAYAQSVIVPQALAILAKYGAAANLYLPGVGAINGITAGNWLDSVGTTAATVDNPVGLVVNARGGANLTQSTAANQPILRLSGDVYSWQFDGTNDSFASTLTPGNAGFFCLGARFIDSGTVRTLVGAGAGGFFESGVWLNRSIDGNLSLIGGNGFGREVAVTACPTGTTFVASCGWTTSSMFVGVNSTETSAANTRVFTSTNTVNVGVLTGTKNPMLGTISGGAIIMPTVLPTPAERATLRQLIASLSGVTL